MSSLFTIPHDQFDAERVLVRRLVEHPPWVHTDDSRGESDRGLRAAYRRWSADQCEPTLDMVKSLWVRVPNNPNGFSEDDTLRAVQHAAILLHFVAMVSDEGQHLDFGKGCLRAEIAESRFARLVNTPAPGRIEAVARAFRRFRQKGIQWSTDDVENMLRFLFTNSPERAVSHWAASYFRSEKPQETEVDIEAAEA